MFMKNIKLPLISYCGIEYNHTKWGGHKEKCKICKESHQNLIDEYVKNWNKYCECGCGNYTKPGDTFLFGHQAKLLWNDENKKLLADRWKGENNPTYKIENRKYGDDNPAKRPEIRKKISENNPMKNPDFRKKSNDNWKKSGGYNKWIDFLKSENNPAKNKDSLKKRTKTYSERLANGDYNITNNWKTGYFETKNGAKEWFDSSYEEKRMQYYEDNNIEWTKKHKIVIPYINESGFSTYYVPDFKIEISGKTFIEEIKGWIKNNDKLKAEAGIKYCIENGFGYNFYLGEKLIKQEKLSYNIK